MPFYENEQIQEEIDALYHIFTREIESQKLWKKLVKQLPGYLKHAKDNNSNLAAQRWNALVKHSS